jgi:primosomal protein N' (replication factor Y)
MGRVGRGHVTAHTIIQTYHPASPLIDDAIHDNWQSFYTAELKERETFLYPPFCYLLKIVCKRASARSAEQACEKVRQQILESHRTVHIDGPAPALHETMNGSHYWQLIVKAKQRSQLLDIIDNLPANTLHDIDPLDLL